MERVSVRELADPAARVMVRVRDGRTTPAFRVRGMVIWGFTAVLVDRLLRLGGWEQPWDAARGRDLMEPSAGSYTFKGVHGDVLDLILLVVIAAFATSGYRQGFIVGVLSFFGFVGGALLGAEFGPSISRALVGGQTQQDVIAMVLLVGFAVIGQFVASSIGAAMRSTVTWRSATVLDSVGRRRWSAWCPSC